MPSKYIVLAIGVALTLLNIAVLGANWSITAHAAVDGMDSRALRCDSDFRRAVKGIVEDCHVRGNDISC